MKKTLIVLISVILAVLVFVSLRPTGPEKNIEYIADGEIIRLLDKEKNVVFEYSIEEFRSWAKENWNSVFEDPPRFAPDMAETEVNPETFHFFDRTAALSPNKEKLAFSVHSYYAASDLSFVGIIDLKEKEPALVAEASRGNIADIFWSPAGTHLAYALGTAQASGDYLSIDNVVEMKKEFTISGEDLLIVLKNSDYADFMPNFRNLEWTEDGQSLKFTSNNPEEKGILSWSINEKGTELKRRLELHFFWAPGCSFCDRQKAFLERIDEEYPDLEIYQYNAVARENTDVLRELMEYYPGSEDYFGSVPLTFIKDKFFVGFDETRGQHMERLIKEHYENAGEELTGDDQKTSYTLPILGEIHPDERSLFGWAVIISLVDGFNICSIGALILILVLVLALDSRKLTFIFGGLFILVTALAYGFLMLLWSQIFSLLIPYMLIMSMIIGFAAFFGAIYFLKQVFKFRKQGSVCNMKDNKLVSAVSQKVERAFKEKKSVLNVLGMIALFAIIVTIIEFPCSAVFPVVFTAMLSRVEPGFSAEVFYISVYIFFYMLIAIAIFLSAVFTKKIWVASGKFMTLVSLIGSLILFALAYHYFSLIPDYLAA